MGRWAQARRRQSVLPVGEGPGPPPAPTLTIEGGILVVTATGVDDPGGLLVLYYALAEVPPVEPFDSSNWVRVWDVLPEEELSPGFYWAQQEGGGVAYSGFSVLSDPLEVV